MIARNGPHHPRLLLVDDHAGLAEATATFLRVFGLHVHVASSGQNALDLAATVHPEIVVCDLRLPDLPGLDVVHALRARRETRDSVLVISTALSHADVQALQSGPTAGDVDLFVTKPLTEDVINKLLEASANRQRRRAPTGSEA